MGRDMINSPDGFVTTNGRVLALSFILVVVSCHGSACGHHLKRPGNEKGAPSFQGLPSGYVDRIEGEYAVLIMEDENSIDWPASGLREGDVVRDGRLDKEATAALKARVGALRRRLSKEEPAWDELEL